MTAPKSTDTREDTGAAAPQKLDLNLTQVTAGALAAVTTAVFTSQLGAAGTIIGAGGASVVTTVGTALYQASLDRSRRRVRSLATRAKMPVTSRMQDGSAQAMPTQQVPTQRYPAARPAQGAPTQHVPIQGLPTQRIPLQGLPTQGSPTWRHSDAGPTQGMPTQRHPSAGPPQGMPTQGMPTQGMPTQGMPGRTQVGGPPQPPGRPPGPGNGRPDGLPAGQVPAQAGGPQSDTSSSADEVSPNRRATVLRWGAAAVGAIGAFVLAMMVITGFEWASGESLGGNGSGTTIGQVAHPQRGDEQPVVPAVPKSSAPSSAPSAESSAPSQSSEAPAEPSTSSSGSPASQGPNNSDLQPGQPQRTGAPQPTGGQPQPTGQRLPVPGFGG